MSPFPSTPPRRPTLGGVLAAIGGFLLFAYFVRRAGVTDVADGIRRLGWVFLVILGLQGARFLIRAAAWMSCMEGAHRLTLGQVFQAMIAGDALGHLTPLSLLVSEPAKAMFLRHREPLRRTLPALAVENLFYTLSAALMIAGGMVALFLILRTPGRLWLAATALFLTLVAIIAVAHWIIWRQARAISSILAWLGRFGVAVDSLARAAERMRTLEDHVYMLYPRSWPRLFSLAALESVFHVFAILEIAVALSFITDRPITILDVFVFESTNRFIQVVFKFIPMRIGVDEAGTGMFADLLAFGTATGVTLAIVRKARMLVWMAIGITFLVRRGLSVEKVVSATTPSVEVALVVMARSPAGSRPPKTRLAAAIPTDADRRRLYAAFLGDTIQTCRRVYGAMLRVACTPNEGTDGFSHLGLADDELIPQRGIDLGARERSVFANLFASGVSSVIIIGSDLPTLPIRHITEAVAKLKPNTMVLGPSEDGGYYLMGLTSSGSGSRVPDVFNNIRWSTPSALEDTVEAARREGLKVALLPKWYDVDDEGGLMRLRADLKSREHVTRAPATAKVIAEIFGMNRV